ncbi:MAG: DinB family protein [Anaerolineae bacterium]|jgi:hypothetical protein
MGNRIDKLVSRLRKGIDKTLDAFGSLEPGEWDEVVYAEPYPWNARDLLAHFVSAEAGLLQLAQDVAAGGPGAPEGFDYHDFNAREQRRLARVRRDRLLDDLIAARRATLAWVKTLEATALDRKGQHPALGEITVETFLNAIYGHQLMHIRDLMRVVDQSEATALPAS